MTLQEIKSLIRRIKKATTRANNRGQWQRVQWLKIKRKQLTKKILDATIKKKP